MTMGFCACSGAFEAVVCTHQKVHAIDIASTGVQAALCGVPACHACNITSACGRVLHSWTLSESHQEVSAVSGVVHCPKAEQGGGGLIICWLLHRTGPTSGCEQCIDVKCRLLPMCRLPCGCTHGKRCNGTHIAGGAVGHTIACAYQGADMKLARSKFCKGPRPLGGHIGTCTRLLLAP